MTGNIKLLLSYEAKKKSHDTLITISFNIVVLALLIIEAFKTIPQISTTYQFINYITFNIYQVFGIILTTFTMISVSCLRDIKNYRYLLSYPINYKELFAFIKIRKLKNFILTLVVNLIAVFYIGIRFHQGLKFFMIFLVGFLIITILCYLISDIVCFLLYSIFSSNLFTTLTFVILCIPILVVMNTIKTGNILNFYNTNSYYLILLDKIFPYCKFIKENLFGHFNLTYTLLSLAISLITIALLSIIYEILIKLIFFKVLEKEDNKKARYTKTNIDKLKAHSIFIASFLKECKFIFRENRKFVFTLQTIFIIFLLLIAGLANKIYFNHTGEEMETISAIVSMKNNYILLALSIYITSLLVDIINFKLNSGRIALGYKYFSFDKYIQIYPKYSIYSIIALRLIISMGYYFILLILMCLYNLATSIGIWTFIICAINIVTVALFDLYVDIKLPNLYVKMKLNNIMIDLMKAIFFIIFKLLHFAVFILILTYIVHNLYLALIINNILLLIPVFTFINSKSTLSSYNKISILT